MKKLFINRKLEIQKLLHGLNKKNDYILIAPRRFGKTSLAKKVLEELKENKDNIIINIDLMSYASGSIGSVAECIIEKSLNALGFTGKLRNLWRNIDFTFNLRMKYQDLEIEPLIHMFKNKQDEWALLEEALQLPEEIAIKQKKHVIVFYDEFGELHNLGVRIIKLFRSILQHHEHVSYLFAGSQETTMNKIFLDKSGAFYRFGEIIYLKELNKQDIYQYMIDKYSNLFETNNGLRDFKIINVIVEQLDGHPYYTSQIIKYLEEKQKCTYEEFYSYLKNDLFERERAYLEQNLIKINEKKHAIDVLRMIAMNLIPHKELNMMSYQHVYNVLCYLENGGYIRKESKGKYKIVDPLLSMLLLDI